MAASLRKRLIICCDGTWMNSDNGYEKPSIFSPTGKVQVPSNVTQISRSFRRTCSDGKTLQVIMYQSGVGTGSSYTDIYVGGAFGQGVGENIREVYAFICANYSDGDEIVLVGFSRGAFTARSVAGMIGDLGLLTRTGMEYFYVIFKDMENWQTPGYKYRDPFPTTPFADKPHGPGAGRAYRDELFKREYTRLHRVGDKDYSIPVKAVAVWDTVGSLGIPNVSWLNKIGIHGSSKEFRFYDTKLGEHIEHAFQALALDETRAPFSPAVWERCPRSKKTTLKQVWFPGNHGNVGGGWDDAGVSSISLAWMMDQLDSVGVEFDEDSIKRISEQVLRYYGVSTGNNPTVSRAAATVPTGPIIVTNETPDALLPRAVSTKPSKGWWSHLGFGSGFLGLGKRQPWAMEPIYGSNHPVRPWALGAIRDAGNILYKFAGPGTRTPGMYRRVDSWTGIPGSEFLVDTNERIHSSVRVRLAAQGLGLEDDAVWTAPALKGQWQLRPPNGGKDGGEQADRQAVQIGPLLAPATATRATQSLTASTTTSEHENMSSTADTEHDWFWEYHGSENASPLVRKLAEEPLSGRYERELLKRLSGQPNIYDFAATINVAM